MRLMSTDFRVNMRRAAPLIVLLHIFILSGLAVAQVALPNTGHPSQRCSEVALGRETRIVSTQEEAMNAVMNASVGCILVANSIRFQPSPWGRDSEFFLGSGCVRFTWPFCNQQVLTHVVAVAPVPGLSAHQAELYFESALYYSTYLEFVHPGALYLLGLRVYGMFDLAAISIAQGLEVLARTADADMSTLDRFDFVNLDTRNIVGGNAVLDDVQGYMHCGPNYDVVLSLFRLSVDATAELDANSGMLRLPNTSAVLIQRNPYVINPRPDAAAPLVLLPSNQAQIAMKNVTFQCCDTVACDADQCEEQICLPDPDADVERASTLEYAGHLYQLLPHTAVRAGAEADCGVRDGARLASFQTLDEYYTVTKALFSTDDGYLLRQLKLPVWISDIQGEALDLHWTMTWSEGVASDQVSVGSTSCVAVNIVTQLLSRQSCVNYFPYICKRPLDTSAGEPAGDAPAASPPSSSAPPPPTSSGGSSGNLFGSVSMGAGLGIVAMLVIVVMLLVYAYYLVVVRARKQGGHEEERNELAQHSVYAMHAQTVNRRELGTINGELRVEGENGAMELKRGMPVQEYAQLINLVTMHTTINNAGSRSRSEPASDLRGPAGGSEGGGGDIVKSSASSQSHSMGADRAHPLAGAELWDGGELRSAADLPGSAAARVDNTQPGSSVYAMHKELLQIRELEGYEMIRLLGHGTHAECYLMKETASNTEWAVKVPVIDDCTTRAVQESYFLQLIKHTNVVSHKKTIVRTGKLILVTEFCDLGDLQSLIDHKVPFSEAFVCHMILQCAMGLARMHACCIAHRDVKPANILLKSEGFFKLGDLGASCMILDLDHISFAGTPAYMAPEILAGKPHGVQTDIYSLGVVAYMLCMHKCPYVSTSVKELQTKVQGEDYQDISTEYFSENLVSLIHSMLSLDPDRRPSAEDICDTTWLFEFCLRDFEQFGAAGGKFHQEIESIKQGKRMDGGVSIKLT